MRGEYSTSFDAENDSVLNSHILAELCSSEILKSFKAKPQSKTIQWFNFSYMGKTNSKSETNIIHNFWWLWCHSFLYDVTKLLVFYQNSCFCNFFMKNYYFNTFSSPGLGLKLQKCVFKVWWRHNPSFVIVWRQNIINFDWKYCLRRISRKNIDYKRFHYYTLSSRH